MIVWIGWAARCEGHLVGGICAVYVRIWPSLGLVGFGCSFMAAEELATVTR